MKSLNDLTLIAQQPFSVTVHQKFRAQTKTDMKEAYLCGFLGCLLICLGFAAFVYEFMNILSAHNVSFPHVFLGPRIVLSEDESWGVIIATTTQLGCIYFSLFFLTNFNAINNAHMSWKREYFIDSNFSPSVDSALAFKEAAINLYDETKKMDACELIAFKNTDGIEDWAQCIIKAELDRRGR